MKTKSKLVYKSPEMKTFEICEVVHPGTLEQYNRLIGHIFEYEWGFEWELTTNRRSGSCFPSKAQALRGLKTAYRRNPI